MEDFAVLLLLALPLLAALVSLLGLRNVAGGRPASWVATASALTTLVIALLMLPDASNDRLGRAAAFGFDWASHNNFSLRLGFQLDRLASSMMVVVTLIGSLVHLFSLVYMKDDEGRGRYFGCLALFLFSMTGIVLAENLLTMFVFWELVGLSSYLLIGHWYHRQSAARASTKAFLANRIGDLGFLAGILGLWALFGSLEFTGLNSAIAGLGPDSPVAVAASGALTLVMLGIFCGAVGKSAQFPLHVWLPDAMEGPTPVSALIHAATMVAAGVFMLVRVSGLLVLDTDLGGFAASSIAWIGAITALLAALMATQQDDIKRILAYSTLSQLGYMVLAVGLLAPEAGYFHLFTHAWFKALLFLGSGAVIFACHHEQNIWRMGGLAARMKTTTLTFLVGTAALAAVPWVTSGFWSKEAILVAALDHGDVTALFAIAAFVAFLTPFYMTRLVLVAFFSKPRSEHAEHAEEVPGLMTVPLVVLAVLSVAAGWRIGPLDIPGVFNVPEEGWLLGEAHAGHHEGATFAAIVSILALLAGVGAAIAFYRGAEREPLSLAVFRDKFYFDEIYDGLKGWLVDGPARLLAWVDRVILGGLIVGGSARLARLAGRGAAALQGGNLAAYAALLVLGLVAVVFFTTFLT